MSDGENEARPPNKEETTNIFSVPPNGSSFHANSFMELNISRPLLRACESLGYFKPTPIQAACIPLALTGRDICGSAITGSGKTAAFALPTLERLLFRPKRVSAIRVLIVTPTRELSVQVHSMIVKLAQYTDIRCCLVVGGLSIKAQETELRSMPDIVVATLGRMIDHLRNSMSVDLEDLSVLILDEADRLLELGFRTELQELVRLCPRRRQTMLFSATLTEEVDELIKLSLTKPVRLSADPSAKRPSTLIEEVVRIRRACEMNQEAVLLSLCSKTFTSKVIVFCAVKSTAHRLKVLFELCGFKAGELHGNMTQVQRLEALDLFRKEQVDFLLATDLAARGLDIMGVQTVINYTCPRDLTSYVHRVGRTARAGRQGSAVTFVSDNDRSLLKSIAKKAGSTLKSRIVSQKSLNKWSEIIERNEDQVAIIFEQEREEMILRKAEMELAKAENIITHREDINSRPKKTWFATEKEKKLALKAAKESLKNDKPPKNEVLSEQMVKDIKKKEEKKRLHEKHLPRKKRRRLEAAREMLENDDQIEQSDEEGAKFKKEKSGISLVELGHRRAKALKSQMRKSYSGVPVKCNVVKRKHKQIATRTGEMEEIFAGDMQERRQKHMGFGKKPGSSFKSKSRFKRR